MQEPERIGELLFKYLRNELTKAEELELAAWRTSSPQKEALFIELTNPDNIRNDLKEVYNHKEVVWNKILEKAPELAVKPGHRKSNLAYFAAAAILVLLFGTGLYIFINRRAVPINIVERADNVQNDIPPGGNHAELILANGTSILLDSAKNGVIAGSGLNIVVKKDSGELVYNADGHVEQGDPGYNTVRTPRGGQYKIILPDGTKVWLNAASSLKYPEYFNGNERKVELQGEAYFEVAKNALKPFKVKLPSPPGQKEGAEVEVLGTHFNIMAYTDEPFIATTLLEGSVKLTALSTANTQPPTVLKPHQQARINKKQEIITSSDVDVETVVAWKNGITSFNDAGIQEIMRMVSRWYDVEIVYHGNIPGKQIHGGIPRNTNLSDLLKVLEQYGIHFKIEGKQITVTP